MPKSITIIGEKVKCPLMTTRVRGWRHVYLLSLSFVKGGQTMLERDYQRKLVKKLRATFPGCIVLKNDAQLKQGIPDLLVLYKDKWVALEVKVSATSNHQPNQDYNVQRMNEMSYAAFIFPENEEQVFQELKEVFK